MPKIIRLTGPFSALLRAFSISFLLLFGAVTQAEDVTIFAAASMQNALGEAKAVYEASHPHKIIASYASSSILAKQVSQRAPANIFISADLQWMDYLAQRKLIVADSRSNLVGNNLVMIAPKASEQTVEIKPGFDLAAALGNQYLAVGDPDAVPAGRYAKSALEWMGVWDKVVTKLARAENVRSAMNFVALKECPLGIVYASDAHEESRVKVIGQFPEEAHPPILYPIALIKGADTEAARSVHAFLASDVARAIFLQHGFIPAP